MSLSRYEFIEMRQQLTALAPKFISIEGGEGVGKSTLTDGLCQLLDNMQIDYVRTREPGGSVVAEKIRKILIDKANPMTSDCELLLMMAARADHVNQVILPALALGKWVICDRFMDSTFAYQGFGRHHGNDEYLKKISLLADQFIQRWPDLTILLQLDVHIAMARVIQRGQQDRFESEGLDFFQRVAQGYDYQLKRNPAIRAIDASGSPEDVLLRASQCLLQNIKI